MTKLRISSDFALPHEAVTQTFAILAKRGVGKTYTASVMAEEMLRAGHQVIAIDPTGAWWGLKSGFPIVIFGGERADVPLEENAGEVIASAIVENRFSAVLDLSLFRKGQLIRFMIAFAETLYRLNREAVHLFVDEADAVAPQGRSWGTRGKDESESRMLGAMEDIVRRGRKRGIGCTLITQRPAVINKNVLTQCESLFAMRLVHPKDIGAVMEWVNVQADPAQAKEMVDSLPSLEVGQAWFWSPGWIGTFKRIHVRKRETFDSSATPKPGESPRKPKSLVEVDLNSLGEKIRATVERARENDPKELKRRIADLQRDLQRKKATPVPVEKPPKRVEVPMIADAQVKRLEMTADKLERLSQTHARFASRLSEEAAGIRESILRALRPEKQPAKHPVEMNKPELARHVSNRLFHQRERRGGHNAKPAAQATGDFLGDREAVTNALTGPEQRIIDAIAWLNSIGVDAPEQTAVAFLAGYTWGGGAFNNPRGSLNTRGLVQYVPGGRIRLTDAGRALARSPDVPLSTEELHRRVLERLPGPEQRILRPLLDAYPKDLANEDLAQQSGYTAGAGAFNNPRGRLRSLGLIEYPSPGRVVAKPLLFLDQ